MNRNDRACASFGLLILAGLVLLVASSRPAQAQNLYRYQDSQGNPVITSTLPDEALKRGYKVIDSSGRVLKTVPPAPTQEELERKARQQAQESARAEARKKQQEKDNLLLRTYSGPDDAVRAMQRKMQELSSLIGLKEGNLSLLQSQLQNEQTKAANAERAGKSVPANVMRKIQNLRDQIQALKRKIAAQQADIGKVKEGYLKKIKRLETLTGKKRTLPLDVPENSRKASASQ